MESCEICGHSLPTEDSTGTVVCSGPCGAVVHASCATVSGIMLTAASVERYWFCSRCQRGLRPVARKRSGSPVPDLGQKLAKLDLPELPTEIWVEIFKHLEAFTVLKVRLVCRRWRDIVGGCSALMGKLTIALSSWSFHDREFNLENMLPLSKASFGNSIPELGPWWPLLGQGLTEIKIDCHNLRDISVLLDIFRHTPNLKWLAMNDVTFSEESSVEADFQLNKLEQLKLEGLKDEEILTFFQGLCCNLKSLKVSWSYELDSEEVGSLEVAKLVHSSQKTLEELHTVCTDELLMELFNSSSLRLKKLTLTCCEFVPDGLLVIFCRMNPTLEYLNVEHILTLDQTNGNVLNELGRLLPELRFLSVQMDHVDIAFMYNIPKLQTLKITCYVEGEETMPFTFTGGGHSWLKSLFVRGVYFPKSSFKQWLATMPNVRTLTLEWCKFDHWTDLLEAFESLQQLEKLGLKGVEAEESTQPCTNLLNLKCLALEALQVSPPTIARILRMCPCLQKLLLAASENAQIEEVLSAIYLRQLPQLAVFSLTGRSLSREAKDYIRQNCRMLQKVQIW